MKKNNKGFSLVELIVVIAIMAVLVGVLAPTLLRYVEKSRVAKDISAIAEVENACVLAMADETTNTAVGTTGQTITIAMDATTKKYTLATTGANKELEIEVQKTIAEVVLSSNALKSKSVAVTAQVTATGNVTTSVTVTGLTGDAATAWTAAGFTNTVTP